MSRRRIILAFISVLVAGGTLYGTAHLLVPNRPADETDEPLPIPPFPPRIAQGANYESCLSTLAADPMSAIAMAASWQTAGGGDGAAHCRGLALIAAGKPDTGAEVLEELAARSNAPALARASVLGQAAQARLMVGQAAKAEADATAAVDLSPEDTDLLILRATARGQLQDFSGGIADLTEAIRLDDSRVDALVARAVMRRKQNQLDLAQDDVARAIALAPDDPDALLERGILRQRMGDRSGARADWERARGIDPNSTTADLAAQNLALLDAGLARQ